jgi:hypothetical protein
MNTKKKLVLLWLVVSTVTATEGAKRQGSVQRRKVETTGSTPAVL